MGYAAFTSDLGEILFLFISFVLMDVAGNAPNPGEYRVLDLCRSFVVRKVLLDFAKPFQKSHSDHKSLVR